VQQLAVHTVGGVVTPAEALLTVVPDDAPVLVEAWLENGGIGFVRAGQDLEVTVETFTFTRYGLLHGHVVDVSRDRVEASSTSKQGQTSGKTGDRAGWRGEGARVCGACGVGDHAIADARAEGDPGARDGGGDGDQDPEAAGELVFVVAVAEVHARRGEEKMTSAFIECLALANDYRIRRKQWRRRSP
jgi:hypothetical protein